MKFTIDKSSIPKMDPFVERKYKEMNLTILCKRETILVKKVHSDLLCTQKLYYSQLLSADVYVFSIFVNENRKNEKSPSFILLI